MKPKKDKRGGKPGKRKTKYKHCVASAEKMRKALLAKKMEKTGNEQEEEEEMEEEQMEEEETETCAFQPRCRVPPCPESDEVSPGQTHQIWTALK